MITAALIVITLVASHIAAFLAGANNARRAALIKDAAESLSKAATSTAKALKKD